MKKPAHNKSIFPCGVCGTKDHKILFHSCNRRNNIKCCATYVECLECSLIYLYDRPDWEEIVRYYSNSWVEGDCAEAVNVEESSLTKVDTNIPKWKINLRKYRFRPHSWPLETVALGSKRLLDIGCGNGLKLREFMQRGYEVTGVDVNEDDIAKCISLLPEGRFIAGEIQDIDLADEDFDYIRLDNTLEHIPNPVKAVEKCCRLLKKGGRLMIYVPHGKSLSMRLMKGNSISSWIPFHLQLFTHRSLRMLLEQAGLCDIRIHNYYPHTWLPLSLVQWKNSRNNINLLKHDCPTWLVLGCYPIGWLASKVGVAEEIIGIGMKTKNLA